MYITIITDCADPNAKGRQETRARALLDVTPTFVGVRSSLKASAVLEASGNIVDVLDASLGEKGIITANVAPRNGEEKHWGNGTPFGFFKCGEATVVTTHSPIMLSLPYKLGLVERYDIVDMEKTLEHMSVEGRITPDEAVRVANSQFRSFDFLPRLAAWLHTGHATVSEQYELDPGTLAQQPAVWMIDSFGNAKITLLGEELEGRTTLPTRWGELPVVVSLKDVPDGQPAVVVGSSGFGDRRFAEIVLQGASAAEKFGIQQGDTLEA
jgi:hypothetical protein